MCFIKNFNMAIPFIFLYLATVYRKGFESLRKRKNSYVLGEIKRKNDRVLPTDNSQIKYRIRASISYSDMPIK